MDCSRDHRLGHWRHLGLEPELREQVREEPQQDKEGVETGEHLLHEQSQRLPGTAKAVLTDLPQSLQGELAHPFQLVDGRSLPPPNMR